MMRKIERQNTGLMAPGQDLVFTGQAGLAGTAALVRAKRRELSRWFSEEYLDELEASWEEAAWRKLNMEKTEFGITETEAVGEGGVLKAVWDLTGAYETGVVFALRKIPVSQATIEICERLEVNPYRLYSEGCQLLTAERGGQLAEFLEQQGIPAAVIGTIQSGIAREMIVQEGRGYLERPQPDEILKFKEAIYYERENFGSNRKE